MSARAASVCAILAAVCGELYSISFVIVARSSPTLGDGLAGAFLLLGGLLSIAALSGLFRAVNGVDTPPALLALGLALLAGGGAAAHGGYDLANALNPPPTAIPDLPSPVDPRGLLTFGVSGIAIGCFAIAMKRAEGFPAGLVTGGYVLAALLVIVYLARLIILNASNPLVLGAAGLTGFIVNPGWYVWLGVVLRRRP